VAYDLCELMLSTLTYDRHQRCGKRDNALLFSLMSPRDPRSDARARIVRAAAELLATGGRNAVTTRAVSAAAGVQPPTIYRHFGDMQGLLGVVARETLAVHVREQASRALTSDPVEDLR